METRRCSLASLTLRLALGFGMAYHGYPKLFDPVQREQFEQSLFGMGVPVPALTAWGIALLEFVGGLLIIVGVLTGFLSVLYVIEMLVATYLVHLPSGFLAGNVVGMGEQGPIFGVPGYEVNVLYIAGFLALLFAGAGAYSIPGLLHRRSLEHGDMGPPPPPRSPFAGRVAPWRRRAPRVTDTHQPF
jgi:putative oxidoreductase